MVILPIRIKETPLENRKILTFKEIKYVILLWLPFTVACAVSARASPSPHPIVHGSCNLLRVSRSSLLPNASFNHLTQFLQPFCVISTVILKWGFETWNDSPKVTLWQWVSQDVTQADSKTHALNYHASACPCSPKNFSSLKTEPRFFLSGISMPSTMLGPQLKPSKFLLDG